MRRSKGFRLGRKLVKVFKWAIHRRSKTRKFRRLNSPSFMATAMSNLCNLVRSLKQGAKGLCFTRSKKSGYIRMGQDPVGSDPVVSIPKGHLAVYVGEKEDDAHSRRYLVPVIYFNHPLFGSLLREAEREFGYSHPGGIQIPCRISDFESVQTRIAATGGGDCRLRWSWRLKRLRTN